MHGPCTLQTNKKQTEMSINPWIVRSDRLIKIYSRKRAEKPPKLPSVNYSSTKLTHFHFGCSCGSFWSTYLSRISVYLEIYVVGQAKIFLPFTFQLSFLNFLANDKQSFAHVLVCYGRKRQINIFLSVLMRCNCLSN